ncbi:MAG: 50S ribosomal protein L1 [Candidatus Dependentiae bacterium]|jgi:large subunit ribosomal protein L1
MSKVGKKHRAAKDKAAISQPVELKEALQIAVDTSHVKFDEAVDVDIVLGIDATKGEQNVRGAVVLPHGLGKKVRVAVFAKGEHEEAATAAGADFVGGEDLVEKIKGGWMDFDAAIATPDMMGVVGKVARILGPRGLLPNAKVGTVTFDVATVVGELKKGRVQYRNDKTGVLHASFGRLSFGVDKLAENFAELLKAVNASKPKTARGRYIKKMHISSSMGVGVPVSVDDL